MTDEPDDDELLRLLEEELHRQQRELSANTPNSRRTMALAVMVAGAKYGDADAQQRLAALVKRFPSLASVLEQAERIDAGIEQQRQLDIARDKEAYEQERLAERQRVAAALRGERTHAHNATENDGGASEGKPAHDVQVKREGSYDLPTSSRWSLSRLRQLKRQFTNSKGPDAVNGWGANWMGNGKDE
jgi:hypothetical protein